MITRADKAIVAGLGAGGSIFAYAQGSGDPHGYGLIAAVVVGVGVALVTFFVPNKAAA